MSPASIATAIDDLYRRAIEHSDELDEPLLIDWAAAVTEATRNDRDQAKVVRRAIRTARKLAKYWAERDPSALPDWRNGVDEALGGKGWEAQLNSVRYSLDHKPDPDLFALVKEWHRMVHFVEWMDGVSYEEWLQSR